MAEVFGSIGSEHVELNNAATEATLKLLLQASLATTKGQKDAIAALAQKAGLDKTSVENTNSQISKLGTAAFKVGAAYGGLSVATDVLTQKFSGIVDVAGKLASGAGQASDIFSSISKVGGPIGLVASGMAKLAKFQEDQLKNYQQLTNSGISFGGSLTDLRLAASTAGMTMDSFSKILTKNAENLTKLGGTANDGALAFKKLSANLYSSETGKELRSLGYTSEQAAEGLINYMALSGGRSKAELADTDRQVKATGAYLLELDELAQITGKSREEQEKKLKKEMEEADFQLFLSTKSEAERVAITNSMTRATALYGQAGADIVKAQAMGVAVQGESGKRLTALSSGTADSIKNDLEIRKQYGNDTAKLNANEIQGRRSNVADMGRFAGAVGSYGGAFKGAEDSVRLSAKDKLLGDKGIADQYNAIATERAARETSQATAAAESQKAINLMGQSIMNNLLPVIAAILPIFNTFVQVVSAAVVWFTKIPGAMTGLTIAVGLLTTAFLVLKTQQALAYANELRRTGGRKLGTPGAPMIVQEVGGGLGGGGGGGSNGKLGKLGKLGKFGKIAGGLGSVLGGLALDYAGDKLKESGHEKLGAGADIGSAAATGAGLGMMLGPMGAGVGAVLGGAYGLYQNWDTLFGGKGNEIAKPAADAAKSAVPITASVDSGAVSSAVVAANPTESLLRQLELLNKQTADIVRFMRDTTENTRNTVSATKALNGNLYPTP